MKPAEAPTMCMHAAMVVCAAALAGCAQCPPFRAAWYLDKPEADAPTIYLALLNEGTQELPLDKLVLNPGGSHSNDVLDHSMVRSASMQPGRLLLVKLDGKLEPCHLPVNVQLHCGNGLSPPQAVAGLLPNYLHDKWIGSCQNLPVKPK